MIDSSYNRSIFINCPFDDEYWPLLQAVVFCVFECKNLPRSALESSDSSQARIEKIYEIINESQLGIHDISRTELSQTYNLPRFNMPLELGIYLGAKRYGEGRHLDKSCLVLDRDPYRYRIFCSDISGQDIKSHEGDPLKVIRVVRNWLNSREREIRILSASRIINHYESFQADIPRICAALDLDDHELDYLDYCSVVSAWLGESSY